MPGKTQWGSEGLPDGFAKVTVEMAGSGEVREFDSPGRPALSTCPKRSANASICVCGRESMNKGNANGSRAIVRRVEMHCLKTRIWRCEGENNGPPHSIERDSLDNEREKNKECDQIFRSIFPETHDYYRHT